MALITPHNSALKALPSPRFSNTQRRQSTTQFLKIIPQAEVVEEAEPSVFPLIQLNINEGRVPYDFFNLRSSRRVDRNVEFL